MTEKSKKLTSPHAFSTRVGGVSTLEHTKGLNLGFERGDGDDVVLKNLEIFAKRAGFDPHTVVSLPQVHSAKVIEVSLADCGKGYYDRNFDALEHQFADGYITRSRGVTLGVKSADCVPILLECRGERGEILAVGAVHAGWRGTVAGIQKIAAEKLISACGANATSIYAAIGPCIHACCFEVGQDVYDAIDALGNGLAEKFCTPKSGACGKYMCDIVALNRALLVSAGVPNDNIDIIDECTYCHPEKYYSHRYSNGERGTMLSVIWIE